MTAAPARGSAWFPYSSSLSLYHSSKSPIAQCALSTCPVVGSSPHSTPSPTTPSPAWTFSPNASSSPSIPPPSSIHFIWNGCETFIASSAAFSRVGSAWSRSSSSDGWRGRFGWACGRGVGFATDYGIRRNCLSLRMFTALNWIGFCFYWLVTILWNLQVPTHH